MKHYVLEDCHGQVTGVAAATGKRKQEIDVIVADPESYGSAEMIVDFYRALNDLVDGHSYTVTLRVISDEAAGGPMYWAGRTAIFWGDIHRNWYLRRQDKSWLAQVLNLSSRSILVGGAVLLLSEAGRGESPMASVHPNFLAAASEIGVIDSETPTYIAPGGRTHSAATKLGALWLLSELVSRDHGEHMAETLRGYIGLTAPRRSLESQRANRLILRSGADPMVRQVINLMLENVEDPLRITDLSQEIGTSVRQLQRRFLARTGVKLLTTYRELRLERAHSLLRHTDLSLLEISAATGFSSTVSLGRAFRTQYGTSPDAVRNRRYAGELTTEDDLSDTSGPRG